MGRHPQRVAPKQSPPPPSFRPADGDVDPDFMDTLDELVHLNPSAAGPITSHRPTPSTPGLPLHLPCQDQELPWCGRTSWWRQLEGLCTSFKSPPLISPSNIAYFLTERGGLILCKYASKGCYLGRNEFFIHEVCPEVISTTGPSPMSCPGPWGT